MGYLKATAGVAFVLMAGTAAWLAAPALHGQDRDVRRELRRFEFARGGSEIGATVRDVDRADMDREQLASQSGAVIDEIRSGGPASSAGVRGGDVVVEFDGERVRSAMQFARLVQETPPGRSVPFVVMRQGSPMTLQVTPEEGRGVMAVFSGPGAPWLNLELPDLDLPGFDEGRRAGAGRFGIGLSDLTPQLASHFGVDAGVLVSSTTEGSPAARAGLRAGDVIVSVDGEHVARARDVRRLLARAPRGSRVRLGMVRDRQERTIEIETEAPDRTTRKPI